ncbi:GAS2-like protein pickled eggs [Eupeodes corollae]|uniref:GAS2-like protein pickled eggs n=1 Tax=Eupeodes corollae TaxID=290404 RepID=UPI002493232E|nr:GAS2-like protein pickled eggs [Eupeodes corollae]XP_055923177.1 GAS2-like protein pickled eggs [Eupeodes corollae]XP_055923178.1 GAS2-like protein pickled eggs [Eupeodes corollae]
MTSVLLEARPYRPFKSSEEYLEAMKEDLAEWLSTMYPELLINAENFMDRLDTGVALCKHANNVRQAAEDYLARRQARNKSMTRSMTSGSAGPILAMGNVHYLPAAKSGTFFSRDNVSNFITWCRKSLKIFECLLFETDDLIMRKNEKHVILCLLEVARRGAKFGMLAPMLVQMERQIDREIAADNKANGIGCGTQTDNTECDKINMATETEMFDTDSEDEEDNDEGPTLMYGPQPQIVTNDLKSLDEMVRDLVEKCTCPSQFPMVRVSEGKYRIGDTKVLIFVRILRSHVMVRVGGGWDTLSHYLDKHDPCRCKTQHRSSVAARLVPRTNSGTNGIELNKAQVIFERSPPSTRKVVSTFNSSPNNSPSVNGVSNLSPSAAGKARSRSPTYRKQLNHTSSNESSNEKLHTPSQIAAPNLARRSMSPSPRRIYDMRKKQTSLDSSSGPKSLPTNAGDMSANHVQFENLNLVQTEVISPPNSSGTLSNETSSSTKFENISDNGSEISDEGYRSLGLIQSNAQKRESIHSQTSVDDAENTARQDQTSSDSQLSPIDDGTPSIKTPEICETDNTIDPHSSLSEQLDSIVTITPSLDDEEDVNKFEQSGVFITEDEITVDIANNTGLRKTGFSTKIYGEEDAKLNTKPSNKCKIPRSPIPLRRRSLDNSSCHSSMADVRNSPDNRSQTGVPVFNRKKPVYRSVRKPSELANEAQKTPGKDVTNTWSGRVPPTGKKRPTMTADTFSPGFNRNSKTRSSQILYDSNGRRVKGGASLTTSPVKNNASSPLAQQLLEAANSAKNDAQILEKMKTLLSRYSTSNLGTPRPANLKKPIYDDFTTAWVNSNGHLERSSSCSPPTKGPSKRSSAASSNDSTHSHSRDVSLIVSPRRDRGLTRIPLPTRQNTELY